MAQQKDYQQGLSLCCLARSMEVMPFGGNGLVEFLDHVSPEAEEINLVDTSPEGRLAGGLKGMVAQNVRIFRTPYDTEDFDYAANRNYSLAQAGREWILVLDPDERIRDWKAIRGAMGWEWGAAYYLMGKWVLYNPSETLGSQRTGMARLFRNGRGYSYSGKVGELLVDMGGEYVDSDSFYCGYEHHKMHEDVVVKWVCRTPFCWSRKNFREYPDEYMQPPGFA